MILYCNSDCLSNPCNNGWCEETMTGHTCHCPDEGLNGKHCEEREWTRTKDVCFIMGCFFMFHRT